jgi:hypothetical protein
MESLVVEKTIIRQRLDDLAEGDIHLANLSAYAKHLVSVDDPDRAANNAGLLYSTVIDAFQQAGITSVKWSPKLILEIGSKERGKYISFHHPQRIEREIRSMCFFTGDLLGLMPRLSH